MLLASCWQWLQVGSNSINTWLPVLARSALVKRMPLFSIKNVNSGITFAGSAVCGCRWTAAAVGCACEVAADCPCCAELAWLSQENDDKHSALTAAPSIICVFHFMWAKIKY